MHLLEWLTHKNLTKKRLLANKNSHSLLVWIPNGTAMLEDSLSVFYKAKHNLAIQFSNLDPRHLQLIWQLPNNCPNKSSLVSMINLFIISKTGSNKVVLQYVNDNVVHSKVNYYLPIKNHQSNKKTWMNLKHILANERSQCEKATLGMIPIIQHFRKDKTIKIIFKKIQ